jgi:uncharacterized protein (TIGR02117 family)
MKLLKNLAIILGLLLVVPTFIPLGGKPEQEGVEIFLVSNDIHIEFILPARTDIFDWQAFTGLSEYALGEDDARWIEIGWGDRRFYFEMPTWDGLTFELAFSALFLPGPSVMHIGYAKTHPRQRTSIRPISISREAYAELVKNILQTFQIDDEQPLLIPGKGYTINDNFYAAKGSYSFLRTCNVWTAEMLGTINLRRPLWSPTKYGLERMWPVASQSAP